jgi:flagellin-like hook-associated protein FlgL
MQRHASDAINYQQQISTGNKYSKASQDATALARGVEIQFDKSRYDMLKKNQDFISTRMAMADAQLGSIHDVLTSMQEIAVRARGPALGVPGLTAIAQQARQNYEHLKNLSVAMDTNDDRYLLQLRRFWPLKLMYLLQITAPLWLQFRRTPYFEIGATT